MKRPSGTTSCQVSSRPRDYPGIERGKPRKNEAVLCKAIEHDLADKFRTFKASSGSYGGVGAMCYDFAADFSAVLRDSRPESLRDWTSVELTGRRETLAGHPCEKLNPAYGKWAQRILPGDLFVHHEMTTHAAVFVKAVYDETGRLNDKHTVMAHALARPEGTERFQLLTLEQLQDAIKNWHRRNDRRLRGAPYVVRMAQQAA